MPVGTPALALTAYATAQDREKVIAAGFEAHLAKPAEPSALIQSVAELAGRSSEGLPPVAAEP